MGNGLTVWNRLEEEHGDYKTVAHIGPDRTVTIYDEEMPQAVRDEIKRIADTSEMTISATQDAPVFAVPPRVQEPPQKEEAPDPYPTLAAQVLRLIGEFDGSRISAMISTSPTTPWAMAPPARNMRPMLPLSAP